MSSVLKLTAQGWLDPSTVRFFFDVRNDNPGTDALPKYLRPLGAPHAFFHRVIIKLRGVIIEDIQDYARVHEMFSILQTPHARTNERAEGFGGNVEIKHLNTEALLPGFRNYQTVCFKPLAGVFMQSKYLPVRYAPIEIELSLSDATEPIVSEQMGNFTTANTSYQYKLENCMLKCDVCTLDNALDNNYVFYLLSGKSLKILKLLFSLVVFKLF